MLVNTEKTETAFSIMGKRCVAMFCGNSHKTGHSMHEFPKGEGNAHVARLWTKFVNVKRKDFKPTPYSCLCSAHFESSQYHRNYLLAESLGTFQTKKCLIDGAVPTIQPIPTGK